MPQTTVQSNSRRQTRRMVCLPRLRGDAKTEWLRRLRPPTTPSVVDIWLAVHKDNRRMPRIRLVVDAIAGTIRARAGELDPQENMPA